MKISMMWLLFGWVALAGCNKDVTDPDDIPDDVETGEVIVRLAATDGTSGTIDSTIDEVWVRFQDVLVHSEAEGWVTLGADREDIDLMTLRGGSALTIGAADVFEGAYDAVRVVIADSWIVIDGAENDLTIDGGLQLPTDGVDFSEDYFINKNSSTVLGIGWDLNEELSVTDDVWKLTTNGTVNVTINADE